MRRFETLRAGLLAGVATFGLAAPGYAADPRDARIEALERKLDELVSELKDVKKERAADDAHNQALEAQISDLKRAQGAQFAQVQEQRNGDVKVSVNNLRPTFASADGKFSVSIRSLLQYDAAYFSQDNRSASGTDLSSGSNFRRARLGVDGKAFGDWSYSFLYDLGGSGTEGARLADAYIQYDGLAPFHFRTGAFATPQGLEDQTSAADLLFLERAGPVDLTRSLAGSDGRKNILSIFAYGDSYYGALTWSAARAGDAAVFDAQQALVGRLAYRAYKSADANIVVSASGNYIFKIPETTVSPASTSALTFQEGPENAVDGTRLISAGAINARKAYTWGIETAGNYKNLYAQGGYFGWGLERRASTLPNPNFSGWYTQASWVITGESKPYNTATASYGSPRPAHPLDLHHPGIGAWELVGRYSVTDLNFNEGILGANTVASAGGIRGGIQKGYTVGLNWYPNSVIRFLFDYQHLNIDRIGTTAPFRQAGQEVDIIAGRAQLAF